MGKESLRWHTRPGPSLALWTGERRELRTALKNLVAEVIKSVGLDININEHPAVTLTDSEPPYLKSSRVLPSITLSIEAQDPETLRTCVRKVITLCVQKKLWAYEKMVPNGNGCSGEEPTCSTLHISHWSNRHRTVR